MPGTPKPHHHDVAIVGAGLAGLVAARTLVSDTGPIQGAMSAGRRCAEAILAVPA